VGQTTAILHLLVNKPANERWAVLINEFDEIGIGIDSGLIR
jgi:G3E family GTPase